jgi:hypothetical protein
LTISGLIVTAVSLPGPNGGDGAPLVLDVFSGSFRDIAQNLINDALNFTIEEIADTINPEIVNVTVDYNTGVLQVLASEYLDLTPASYFDIDEMFFSDKSENAILEIQTMKVVGSAELGGTFSLNLGSHATSKISPSQISQVQEIRIASDAELGGNFSLYFANDPSNNQVISVGKQISTIAKEIETNLESFSSISQVEVSYTSLGSYGMLFNVTFEKNLEHLPLLQADISSVTQGVATT